jgi:hypothetical protein
LDTNEQRAVEEYPVAVDVVLDLILEDVLLLSEEEISALRGDGGII